MRIVIVGDGKMGLALTQMLTAENHDITVIDTNRKVLEKMQENCDALAVQGHGASRHVLEEAGAGTADLLIAATSADEINLLSCLIANKMGCRQTIARVRNPEYAEDLTFLREELGLSFTINPEEACAREIFYLLQFPSFLEREQFARGRVELVRFTLADGSPLAGVALKNLHTAVKARVLVCAVVRDGHITIPHGEFVLQAGDDIYVTAQGEYIAALIKYLGLASHKITQVTLVGGSRIALYLAHRLIKSGVGVKIIEQDAARCVTLAQLLPEADIVEGDGTDREVLLAESVDHCDALVALTGIDEENIVLAMYARQLGVPKLVTKCNRTQYSDMFRKTGINTVVSPKQTSADIIVRYVRAMENSPGGEILTMHTIADGQAEAMEFLADESSAVCGIPLVTLPLRAGVLIASISRGRETIIPKGDSVVRPGDSVVVVTANPTIRALDDIVEKRV